MSSDALTSKVEAQDATCEPMTDTPGYVVVRQHSARVHLAFLDGMRGIAALYVVCHHAYLGALTDTKAGRSLNRGVGTLLKPLSYGHFAVGVFIVLSGYCLMLPVARSANKELRGGTLDYIKRRAQRILPPYYAALGLSLLLLAIVPGLQTVIGFSREWSFRGFGGSILTHVFMVHNVSAVWSHDIDPPMWSVATEWDIYFIFALLLLPVWRRWGSKVMLLVAFVTALCPHWLFYRASGLDWAFPWYVGLFALGMAAATVDFDAEAFPTPRRPDRWPAAWTAGALAMVGVLSLLAAKVSAFCPWSFHTMPYDLVVGLAAIYLILYCRFHAARWNEANAKAPLLLRLLESCGAVRLGTFSYSLYLIHYPILAVMYGGLRGSHLSVGASLAALLVAGVPLTLALAYGFYLLFERPFLSGTRQTGQPTTAAVIREPAL